MRPTRPQTLRLAGGPPVTKAVSEEITRLQSDLQAINQKVLELGGAPTIDTSGGQSKSIYVNNLRTAVGVETDIPESKLSVIEKILTKISDLDRLVLQRTAPTTEQPARRSSKSAELSSIPTHFYILNRLLDLHAEAKRVTVVRTHTVVGGSGASDATESRPESPRSSKDIKAIEVLNNQIARLNRSWEESNQKLVNSQQEANAASRELSATKADLERALANQRDLENRLQALSGVSAELESAKAKLNQLENDKPKPPDTDAIRQAAAQAASKAAMEKYDADQEKLLSLLKLLAGAVSSRTIDRFPVQDFGTLSPKAISVVSTLYNSILEMFQVLQGEINQLNAIRVVLEGDLSTSTLQRDMLSKDLNSVSSELEVMKGAYSGMESEFIDLRRRYDIERQQRQNDAPKPASNEELLAAQRRLSAANDLLQQLQEELAAAAKRNAELEKLPTEITNLELRVIALESEGSQMKATISGLSSEIETYKSLIESMKAKMKSTSSGADTKDFLDTFEEVMRDEMATMKAAFEAKLRAARDESEQLTRKHSQEILRLHQQTSTSPALARFNSTNPSMKMAASQLSSR